MQGFHARAGRGLRRAARALTHVLVLALLGPLVPASAATDFARLETLARQRYGAPAVEIVRQWHAMLEAGAHVPESRRLELVNAFFNERIEFASDSDVWSTADYWATPLETMGRRKGDCEDFSIAKYSSLLLLGIPAERLRMVYVKASIGGPQSRITQAHMIVAYYAKPGAEPLILDNLLPDILPASRRTDLRPVFSFNSAGLWVGSESRPADTHPERRLSNWGGVLQRMQEEGLRWDPEKAA